MMRIRKVSFLLFWVFLFSLCMLPFLYAQTSSLSAEELAQKIAHQKRIEEQERKMLVEGHTTKGIFLYKEGEYAQALDEFTLAESLDPHNKEVARYIEKCRGELDKTSNKYFLRGVKLYTAGQLLEAAEEFALVPESSSRYEETRGYLSNIEGRLKDPGAFVEETIVLETIPMTPKEKVEQRIKELEEERVLVQLRKRAQEEAMMLEVEKAYYPAEVEERAIAEEAETEEEMKERKKEEEIAKVAERLNSISVPALSLTDADIRDVVRQLMNMTGETIVLNEAALDKVAAGGTVRVSFSTVKPIPLLDLLELALRPTELGFRVEPTYIWVSDRPSLIEKELVTKVYKLKYGIKKIREVTLTEFSGGGEEEEEY